MTRIREEEEDLIILGHTAVISIDDVSDLALPGSDHSVMPF